MNSHFPKERLRPYYSPIPASFQAFHVKKLSPAEIFPQPVPPGKIFCEGVSGFSHEKNRHSVLLFSLLYYLLIYGLFEEVFKFLQIDFLSLLSLFQGGHYAVEVCFINRIAVYAYGS